MTGKGVYSPASQTVNFNPAVSAGTVYHYTLTIADTSSWCDYAAVLKAAVSGSTAAWTVQFKMAGADVTGPVLGGYLFYQGNRINPNSTHTVDLYLTRTSSSGTTDLSVNLTLQPHAGSPVVDALQIASQAVSLPAPWQTTDIGGPGVSGSANFSSGVYTIAGGGSDIWNTSDQFRYVDQPSSGDCSVVAQVTSVQNSDTWAKAGVMIRESTAANAANAAIFLTPGQGISFQWRASTGAGTVNAQQPGLAAPYWLKLTRTGNSFAGYYSTDGANWIQLGTAQTLSMASSATAGLAVTSHNNAALCAATFNNVSIVSLPSPWQTFDVGSPGLAGSASYNNGTFTLTASGTDIQGASDQFRYVEQASSGDCSMVAQVLTVQTTDQWAKSGVMIRESTAANAIHAAVFLTPGQGISFQWRTTTGGSCNVAEATGVAPYWVKLTRTGNAFAAYYSSNGASWTQLGPTTTITMASSATIGLAATSHNNGTLCTSTIGNVTATP